MYFDSLFTVPRSSSLLHSIASRTDDARFIMINSFRNPCLSVTVTDDAVGDRVGDDVGDEVRDGIGDDVGDGIGDDIDGGIDGTRVRSFSCLGASLAAAAV